MTPSVESGLAGVGFSIAKSAGSRGGTRPGAPVHDGKCGANALRATIVGTRREPSGKSRLIYINAGLEGGGHPGAIAVRTCFFGEGERPIRVAIFVD